MMLDEDTFRMGCGDWPMRVCLYAMHWHSRFRQCEDGVLRFLLFSVKCPWVHFRHEGSYSILFQPLWRCYDSGTQRSFDYLNTEFAVQNFAVLRIATESDYRTNMEKRETYFIYETVGLIYN